MSYVIYIIVAAVAVLFAGGSFYVAHKEHQERKAKEKELKEARANVQHMAEANETKENANSGNIDNDVNYMGDILHQLAQK